MYNLFSKPTYKYYFFDYINNRFNYKQLNTPFQRNTERKEKLLSDLAQSFLILGRYPTRRSLVYQRQPIIQRFSSVPTWDSKNNKQNYLKGTERKDQAPFHFSIYLSNKRTWKDRNILVYPSHSFTLFKQARFLSTVSVLSFFNSIKYPTTSLYLLSKASFPCFPHFYSFLYYSP